MTRTAGFKLLIVDDNAPMRQTLRALLSPLASDIHEAIDGGQAVRLFTEQHPDWVVMDVQMKPMNGLAATRAIRRRYSSARIVIVTQYDDADLQAEAAAAGACAYVLKDNLAALTKILAGASSSSWNLEGETPPAP